MMRISLGRGEERNQHDSGVFGEYEKEEDGRVREKLWRGGQMTVPTVCRGMAEGE